MYCTTDFINIMVVVALKAAPGRSFVSTVVLILPITPNIPACTELFKSREEAAAAAAAPAADGGLESPRTRPGGSIADRWKTEPAVGALHVAEAQPEKKGSAEISGSGEFAQVSFVVLLVGRMWSNKGVE